MSKNTQPFIPTQNDNTYMSRMKNSLASQYAHLEAEPFYSSAIDPSVWDSPSSNTIVDKIKSETIDLTPMGALRNTPNLSKAKISIVDEYHDENMTLIVLDINDKNKKSSMLISSVDFSDEYQAHMAIREKDENFYSSLSDIVAQRKAHNAIMDIVDRNSFGVDAVSLKALETLGLVPEQADEREMFATLMRIKEEMLSVFDRHGIQVNAMNNLHNFMIQEIHEVAREYLISCGLDKTYNDFLDEIKNSQYQIQDLTR